MNSILSIEISEMFDSDDDVSLKLLYRNPWVSINLKIKG